MQTSPVARRLQGAQTIDDLREIARRRTPRAVFDYTDGAAGAEESLRRSRAVFDSVELIPRVLRDVSDVDVSTTILERKQSLPLIFAPTGFTRMMHHTGESAVVRAASRAGLPYALSTMGTTSIEDLAAAAPDARRWFQLYLWRDREASRDFAERADANGYDTLILTLDTPVSGRRLRDLRNGMTIPPTLRARTVIDGARHPHWWFNFLTTEPLEFASLRSWGGTGSSVSNLDPTATIADLEWVRGIWPGRLVVKGIQTVDDARLVVDAGADGIVISNHGGRQLDKAPTPLETLPAIVDAVGDRSEVFIDGAVRSGADIIAAVALGARAVLIGRAYLYGLMAGGGAGVDRVLDILGTEMVNTMQLMGVTSLAELTPDRVRLR
ncbi:alpha-hydroxy acid oxidase [Gordonia neofelifaecis]|uniref:FMN-dependent alpha-hydroxy acid dehydrogenase n=1 Tax=Gordonia neofelifaecis NRRL B-59395 TaxID=644548 RepID=F1YGX3_9ACTN|nr:alpha-hydroxy acid oxidase [Gordonia neofelifaecis]EGD56271.1 FMN-dependent alpha-hydroxy acid dehydrogenase [Gordonia neofelifaecis NRRL B-59395]